MAQPVPIFAKDYIDHFDKIMKKKAVKQQLIEHDGIEICYWFDDGDGRYFMVAPVCFAEHDGRCYLLAIDWNNVGYAFDVARIVESDEILPDSDLCEEFNIEALKDALFNRGIHKDGYIATTEFRIKKAGGK